MKRSRPSTKPARYKHKKKSPQVDEAIIRELMVFLKEKLSKERQKEKEALTRLINIYTKAQMLHSQYGLDELISVSTVIPMGTTDADLRRIFPELLNGIAEKIIQTVHEHQQNKRSF